MATVPKHQHDALAAKHKELIATLGQLQKDFDIAHKYAEFQREEIRKQEEVNAKLRLELEEQGGGSYAMVVNGKTVDDSTIKNYASTLDRQIGNFAKDLTVLFEQRRFPALQSSEALKAPALLPLLQAIGHDIPAVADNTPFRRQLDVGLDNTLGVMLQAFVRHAFSLVLADNLVNEFFVTESREVNVGLAEIHQAIKTVLPKPASIWRLQTFKVAKAQLSPGAMQALISYRLPALASIIAPTPNSLPQSFGQLLEGGRLWGRMVHGAKDDHGGFYRAYVPKLGEPLDPGRVAEVDKRCLRTETGSVDVVGACLFPGLIKETPLDGARGGGMSSVVIRRAIVYCECSIMPRSASAQPAGMGRRAGSISSQQTVPAYEPQQNQQQQQWQQQQQQPQQQQFQQQPPSPPPPPPAPAPSMFQGFTNGYQNGVGGFHNGQPLAEKPGHNVNY
ncbi:hypothetical protein T439DRAFT_310176 [Meredithblackwellia eburnea MCA 4105]